MDGKLISLERSDVERNLTSHCEKQSANHKPAYDQVCVTTAISPSIFLCHRCFCPSFVSYMLQRQEHVRVCGAWG